MAVLSSAETIASGADQHTAAAVSASSASRGPPADTVSSIPYAEPLTAKKVMPISWSVPSGEGGGSSA